MEYEPKSRPPRSEAQRQAARINGAKSLGPVTPEGKRISSMNRARRTLLSKTVLIEGESPAHFAALLRQLIDEFQPLPGNETSLIESMAVSRWRQLRLWGMESSILSLEIRNHRAMTDEALGNSIHAVYAARNLTDHSRLLEYLSQEQSRCELRYATAHKRLLDSRTRRATIFHAIEPGVPEISAANPLKIQETAAAPPPNQHGKRTREIAERTGEKPDANPG